MPSMLTPADRQEFAARYREVHVPFARYCASRCLGADGGTLEDVMQEAVLGALERGGELGRSDRLLAYLIGTADNQLRNRLRARRVRERYAEQRRRALRQRLPDDPDAAVELALVLEAIERLPDRAREALLLTAVGGLSPAELAEVQGGTPGAAKVRVHRARQRLLAELEAERPALPLTLRLAMLAGICAGVGV